jgi:hypothetical protein
MPKSHCHIHIKEQKVFTDLGEAEEGDRHRWVLDTGATNHTTGSREIFAELDSEVCDTVHFGDGSVMSIEGRGYEYSEWRALHPHGCLLHTMP